MRLEESGDPAVLQMMLGVDDHVQKLASDLVVKLGCGVHSGAKLPNFLSKAIILNVIPLFYTQKNIKTRIENLFTSISKKIPIKLYNEMYPIIENIYTLLLKTEIHQNSQITLIFLIYKKKKEYVIIDNGDTVSIPKSKQVNNFCWYMFDSRMVSFGGFIQ